MSNRLSGQSRNFMFYAFITDFFFFAFITLFFFCVIPFRNEPTKQKARSPIGNRRSRGGFFRSRDSRLYREQFETIEAYCKTRWNFSRPRVYQLMEAAGVVADLSTVVDKLPDSERQARALAQCADDPETRAEVWKAVVEESGDKPITVNHQRQVLVVGRLLFKSNRLSIRTARQTLSWLQWVVKLRGVRSQLVLEIGNGNSVNESLPWLAWATTICTVRSQLETERNGMRLD